MKKIVTWIALILFLSAWFSVTSVFSEDRTKAAIVKDIILKKRELEKSSSKWELYVQALDAYFEKYSEDTKKIQDLVEKVALAKTKLSTSAKEQEILLLIEYIEYKGEVIGIKKVSNSNVSLEDTLSKEENSSSDWVQNTNCAHNDNTMTLIKGIYKKDSNCIYSIRLSKNISYPNKTPKWYISIHSADFDSFETIWYWTFGKDLNNIYHYNSKIQWIDHNTFELFSELDLIFKDKNNIFTKVDYKNTDEDNVTFFTIPNVDVPSYKYLHAGVWKDLNNVYYYNEIVEWISDISSFDLSSPYSYSIFTDKYNSYKIDKWVSNIISPQVSSTNDSTQESSSEVNENLRTMAKAIELIKNNSDFNYEELINGIKKEEESSIWKIYSWTPNYSLLWLDLANFGVWYKISYSTESEYPFYQIMGLTQTEDESLEVILKWDYIKFDDTDPESLFINSNTWKFFKNGDIVAK